MCDPSSYQISWQLAQGHQFMDSDGILLRWQLLRFGEWKEYEDAGLE